MGMSFLPSFFTTRCTAAAASLKTAFEKLLLASSTASAFAVLIWLSSEFRLDHEIDDSGGKQRRERPKAGGAEPARVGKHLAPGLDLVLFFRVGKRRLRLLDLDLEGWAFRRAAEPQHRAASDHCLVLGRHAIDADKALAFEVDAIVAGFLPLEKKMPLADDGAFRRVDDLAVGLATELYFVHFVVEVLLGSGEGTFEMLDGDGHGLLLGALAALDRITPRLRRQGRQRRGRLKSWQ